MQLIKEYNDIIKKIIDNFWVRYYKELYNEDYDERDVRIIDYQWISSWPVEICDNYYSIDDILISEFHQIPCKIMQEWYDVNLENYENKDYIKINLYNYWRKKTISKEILEKEKEDDLKKSRGNIAYAFYEAFELLKKNN